MEQLPMDIVRRTSDVRQQEVGLRWRDVESADLQRPLESWQFDRIRAVGARDVLDVIESGTRGRLRHRADVEGASNPVHEIHQLRMCDRISDAQRRQTKN